MIGPLTYLDLVLIAVSFLSGLLALYRGLTREILSVTSWAVAGATALYIALYQPQLGEDVGAQVGIPPKIALIGIAGMAFLILLVVVHLITSRISDTILDSRIGMIDRTLGFAFGVARGFLLVVIPFMFYEQFVPADAQRPVWVREAKTLPYIKSTGDAVNTALRFYFPKVFNSPQGEQQG